MALVSHQHGFIYLKTEKTGGTSVEMALQTLCTPPGTKVTHRGPALVSRTGVVGARGARHTAGQRFGWTSHMPAWKLALRLGPRRWSRYVKVASLRNPFDKAVSWYWYMAQKQGLDTRDPVAGFRGFLRDKEEAGYFRSRIDIDWRVTHIANRPVIDEYLRLEQIETDLAALYARLGIDGPVPVLPRAKTQSRKADALPVQAYFDRDTTDLLHRNWGWIFDAGGYSRDPADAGRASKAANRQAGARDTAVPVQSPRTTGETGATSARQGGRAAGVNRLPTRRAV